MEKLIVKKMRGDEEWIICRGREYVGRIFNDDNGGGISVWSDQFLDVNTNRVDGLIELLGSLRR
jgi:hypothetical protein